MRHLVLAIALACVLSGVARAGEIPTSDRTTPQASSSVVRIHSTDAGTPQLSSTGEIPSTDATEPELSTIVLTILMSIISIVR